MFDFEKKKEQDRSHQWSTRLAHRSGRQWLSLDFEVWEGRTDNLCENSDHYRDCGRPRGSKKSNVRSSVKWEVVSFFKRTQNCVFLKKKVVDHQNKYQPTRQAPAINMGHEIWTLRAKEIFLFSKQKDGDAHFRIAYFHIRNYEKVK